MAITITGDGTITGLSAGGLPDNSVQTADIADDQITLAKLAGGTDGQIITYDASGNPVAVGPGSTGQVLTSTGAGSPPAFAAGGKIVQVVQTAVTATGSSAAASWTNLSGVTLSITPAATSSKILLSTTISGFGDVDGYSHFFRFARSGTGIAMGAAAGSRTPAGFAIDTYGAGGIAIITAGMEYLDSPSTTSAITYTLQHQRSTSSAGTFYFGRNDGDSDQGESGRYPTIIIAKEVAA